MAEQDIIQITEEIPETHYFVFKEKKFPFNFYFFENSSKFFSNNKVLQKSKIIPLVDKEYEESLNISDESIETFIKYVHRQKIAISNENVVSLNYLSKKYEIPSLIEFTKQYIAKHRQDILLDILTIEQNHTSSETGTYEDILSEHLIDYINDERLLTLKIPILYRVLTKYQLNFAQSSENKEIIEFLMKCLDKYKREASVLFTNVGFGDAKAEYLHRLMTDYSNVFDFHFINSTLVQTLYEKQNQQILQQQQQAEMMKKIEDEMREMRKEMSRMRDEQERQLNEYKQSQLNQISEIKESVQSVKNEMVEESNKNKEEMKKLVQEKRNESVNEINGVKSLVQNTRDEMNGMKEENRKNIEEMKNLIQEKRNESANGINEVKSAVEKITQAQNTNDEAIKNIKESIQKQDEKEHLQKEFEKIKASILTINFSNIFDSTINEELFNKLDGDMQISIMQKMNPEKNNEGINQIQSLLEYLSREYIKSNKQEQKKPNYILFHTEIHQDQTRSRAACISWSMTEILFENGSLDTSEFSTLIKNLSEIYVEIKYPSDSYESIYELIKNMKNSKNIGLKISIFISGITETNQKFQGNCDINYVKLDSCITKIKGGDPGSFGKCTSLTQISIPSSVTSIERYAFDGAPLTQVSLPSSIISIGYAAFIRCKSLMHVSIPSSVTTINDLAFQECSSLREVSIPSSVTSIGSQAFYSCSSLAQIVIPSSVSSIASYIFKGCLLLKEVYIPSSITLIEKHAFYNCKSLTQIAIPSSVTSIGESAFEGCTSLNQITIPSSINRRKLGIRSNVNIIPI